MSTLPRLLKLLRRKDYIPLPEERLAEALGLDADERAAFHEEVQQHLKQGTLVKLKKNRLCLPRDADLVTGTIKFRQSGAALLWPDPVVDGQKPEPLLIRAEDTGVALHRDRVIVRINQDRQRRERYQQRRGKSGSIEPTGRVIRILERARTSLTGTLKRGRASYYVIPSDPRIIQDIIVAPPREADLDPAPQIDDKVVVELHEWEQRHLNPEGRILRVLGETFTPGAEYLALLHEYGLDPEFPQAVVDEVEALPTRVRPSDIRGRTDLRKVPTVTIDPQDAKDFDDALSLEPLEDGRFRIGIHIADVGHYVRPGTALDAEARRRGNSTYLVGTVIPMLPHALSNGLCSLVEGEDRLTQSVFLTFTPRGRIETTQFASSVIRSRKRLTYEQAFALLFEDDLEVVRALPRPPAHQTGSTGRALDRLGDGELGELQSLLRTFWKYGKRLREKRMRKGSLDLDMPETKIYVDEAGYADRIVKIDNDESHQLIEEFMLAANEAVARRFDEGRIPGLFRVHDDPDPDKLAELGEYYASMGLPAGDLTQREHVAQALQALKTHPQAHLLKIQFLRSMKQAQYRASSDGHYGLYKKHYTHFTSPIRRYSDLVVHRILNRKHEGARKQGQGQGRGRRKGEPAYTPEELDRLARHLTLTEQNSTEAERESNKIKLLEFFERELDKPEPQQFEAVIVDIRNHGMFVELSESLMYGLIHSSTLQDDLYSVTPDQDAFVGRKTQRRFALGDTLSVLTHRVDRFKRQVDFRIADDASQDGDTLRQGGGQPAKGSGRSGRKRSGKGTSGAKQARASKDSQAQAAPRGARKGGRRESEKPEGKQTGDKPARKNRRGSRGGRRKRGGGNRNPSS